MSPSKGHAAALQRCNSEVQQLLAKLGKNISVSFLAKPEPLQGNLPQAGPDFQVLQKIKGNVTVTIVGGAQQKGVAKRPLHRDGREETKMPATKKQCRRPSRQEPGPHAQPQKQQCVRHHHQEAKTPVSPAIPATGERWTPSPQELQTLQKILKKSQVPVLSVEEAKTMLGRKARLLGEGTHGQAYINFETNLVVKFSTSFKSYISAITEAIALTSLKKVPGVQWLVGVCPEQALMVTHYGGPILRDWYHPAVVVLPKEWVEIAIEIVKAFMDIHSCNLVHNDIKCNNICVSRAQGGFKVTVIDFGLSKKEGQRIRLSGFWQKKSHYPPEFFQCLGGECSSLSDVYGIGRLLKELSLFVKFQTSSLFKWIKKSQSPSAESREGLEVLLKALQLELEIQQSCP